MDLDLIGSAGFSRIKRSQVNSKLVEILKLIV